MSKYGEPWTKEHDCLEEYDILDCIGVNFCVADGEDRASRIIQCVNAMEGVGSDELAYLGQLVRRARAELLANTHKGNFSLWNPTPELLVSEVSHHFSKWKDAAQVGDLDLAEEFLADLFNYTMKGMQQLRAAMAGEGSEMNITKCPNCNVCMAESERRRIECVKLRAQVESSQQSVNELSLHCQDLEFHNKLLREALGKLLNDIDGLIAESYGVSGLHLNGNDASWDELIDGGCYEGWLPLEHARQALEEVG